MSDNTFPVCVVATFCVAIMILSIPKAVGQGAPQPIPVPAVERLRLLGGAYKRGSRVTVWTTSGHEFTGRLQDISLSDFVLLKRESGHVRIEKTQIYAVTIGAQKDGE